MSIRICIPTQLLRFERNGAIFSSSSSHETGSPNISRITQKEIPSSWHHSGKVEVCMQDQQLCPNYYEPQVRRVASLKDHRDLQVNYWGILPCNQVPFVLLLQ
jgi:hypothetical protein